MPDNILVIVEQRDGKLNRVSWETLTAGQSLGAETGWTLEAAVVGGGVTNLANEIAAKKVAKVFAIESPKLEPYAPDAFASSRLITSRRKEHAAPCVEDRGRRIYWP